MTRHEQRSRIAILADPLARMHLLLNEYGWATTANDTGYGLPTFRWSHPAWPGRVITTRHCVTDGTRVLPPWHTAEWREVSGIETRQPSHRSVSGLRARLVSLDNSL